LRAVIDKPGEIQAWQFRYFSDLGCNPNEGFETRFELNSRSGAIGFIMRGSGDPVVGVVYEWSFGKK
jgi:hypothetical protein